VLPSVLDGLFEDAVLVAQTIAHRRQFQRRHRFDEAGGKPSEPSISQPCIRFLLEQLQPVEALLPHAVFHDGVEQQVGDIVGKRAADEELHREIIDAFRVLPGVSLLCQNPAVRENIAHGAGEGLESLARMGGGGVHDVVEEEVPVIQSVNGAGERNRAASILVERF
jgi:hypothetical protein